MGFFFDTGCNNTSEGASGSEKNPACASSESYSKELKQTLLASMPNWEIKNTTECTTVVCFQELSTLNCIYTYKGPCCDDFQMYHSLYTAILYKLKELFFSGSTQRHKDRPQPRGKCSVQGTSVPRYYFEGNTTSVPTYTHEQRSFALEFTSLLVIKP